VPFVQYEFGKLDIDNRNPVSAVWRFQTCGETDVSIGNCEACKKMQTTASTQLLHDLHVIECITRFFEIEWSVMQEFPLHW